MTSNIEKAKAATTHKVQIAYLEGRFWGAMIVKDKATAEVAFEELRKLRGEPPMPFHFKDEREKMKKQLGTYY